MNKARSYVKSIKLRWGLARAFLADAWGKWRCERNEHDDGMGEHFELLLSGPHGTALTVGTRVVWTCARCGSRHAYESFSNDESRKWWATKPQRRLVIARDWSK